MCGRQTWPTALAAFLLTAVSACCFAGAFAPWLVIAYTIPFATQNQPVAGSWAAALSLFQFSVSVSSLTSPASYSGAAQDVSRVMDGAARGARRGRRCRVLRAARVTITPPPPLPAPPPPRAQLFPRPTPP
jgi:hypothetical protein